jgi:hypothetical protein
MFSQNPFRNIICSLYAKIKIHKTAHAAKGFSLPMPFLLCINLSASVRTWASVVFIALQIGRRNCNHMKLDTSSESLPEGDDLIEGKPLYM